ncbi:ABC transporter ATP-binding protein [Micromonospora sp. NPDC049523]|uniref:ABC transporter ATP-binding protein n=1 Tax=Micromonospora sp. NPDC049523 TaxID=3155921 RepID=UPI003423E242
MNETVVTTSGLTKRYGGHTAVDRVDLTVRRGEVYGFLGANGAGKTTTLRMLLGLVRPTAGTARVLGHRPGDPAAMARTGALIEGPGFYPYLCGRDNLRVMARYRGLGDVEVDAVLDRVALSGPGREAFRSYSLGMKQRLGVAAALLGDPDLLVLDEPTNGLDPSGMADMRELLAELARQGKTVLLSSHLLGEVQEVCDRVGVISAGRLITESTVAELRGVGSLYVRADPIERALAVVVRIVGEHAVERSGDGIRLAVDAALAPDIARALVEAGVLLHELRVCERSLEEVFFQLTTAADASVPDQTQQRLAKS